VKVKGIKVVKRDYVEALLAAIKFYENIGWVFVPPVMPYEHQYGATLVIYEEDTL
jgi:hypothetical protein